MIKVFVQKTMAKADIDTPLTSGSVGLEVEFVFSEDWSGLTKTAVFETSAFYKETAPLSTASTIVPADVMAWEEETLYIGVYGTAQNGEIVIPTVYANCGRIHKGANDSEGGRPLIPAQSDILQNQIDSLGDRVAWLEETGGGGGGAGILLDPTLTQPGKAADAKAVGDALEQKQDAGNYLTDHNTFVGDVNTSSEAFYEAFSARKPCFLLRSDAGGGMVMWVAHDCTSRAARFYNVTPDGTVRYATLEGLVFSYESAAGGSGNVFVGDENTTVAEFYEAYQAGKVCFMKRASGPSGTVTWVSYNCTQYFAFFYHVTNGGAVFYARLSEDGTWTTNRAFSDVVKSVNGITPDPSGKVTLPIPTTLPNPHKLTFSGAVNAEYDGSEAVEVVIPQGGGGSSGGGGANIVCVQTELASGIIPAGEAAWTGYDLGVTLADIQKWEEVLVEWAGMTTSSFWGFKPRGTGVPDVSWVNGSSRQLHLFEWVDSAHTCIRVNRYITGMGGGFSGIMTNTSNNVPRSDEACTVVAIANWGGVNPSAQMMLMHHVATDADVTYKVWGITKKEE